MNSTSLNALDAGSIITSTSLPPLMNLDYGESATLQIRIDATSVPRLNVYLTNSTLVDYTLSRADYDGYYIFDLKLVDQKNGALSNNAPIGLVLSVIDHTLSCSQSFQTNQVSPVYNMIIVSGCSSAQKLIPDLSATFQCSQGNGYPCTWYDEGSCFNIAFVPVLMLQKTFLDQPTTYQGAFTLKVIGGGPNGPSLFDSIVQSQVNPSTPLASTSVWAPQFNYQNSPVFYPNASTFRLTRLT